MAKKISGKERHIFKHAMSLLTTFALCIGLCLLIIGCTGSKSWKPRLGIDLQGGTTVTLTPRSATGAAPTKEQLAQAQEIIQSRVNGRGISGAEVVVAGSNIQITIPGDDQGLARSLGVTAQLFIRPVKNERPATPPPAPTPPSKPSTPPVPSVPSVPVKPSTPAPPQPSTPNLPSKPSKPSIPQPTTPSEPIGSHTQVPAGPHVSVTPRTSAPVVVPEDPEHARKRQLAQGFTPEQVKAITEAKKSRQSNDEKELNKIYTDFICPADDVLRGNDDPHLPLVTCSTDKTIVYQLEPSIISGQDISNAKAALSDGRWKIELSFRGAGAQVWPQYTASHIGVLTAFTLDTQVLSAPRIESAIAGDTEISGNFTQSSAMNLANQLKYGGLPLSFDTGTAQTISATLGFASLQAGLLAGAIGIVIVLLFSCVYYRLLGVLVAISLALSLVLVYVVFVLLGRMIGLTLDLPGIAGLIIGIGMTADSFVVYFERIKDEMRSGRSVKTAVSSAWPRAKRTILTGNSVSFLAAAVLYFLAVGAVRGFAFTLGLTSVLDLIIVFSVTHPIMELVSISPRFSARPRMLGLGSMVALQEESVASLGTSSRVLQEKTSPAVSHQPKKKRKK